MVGGWKKVGLSTGYHMRCTIAHFTKMVEGRDLYAYACRVLHESCSRTTVTLEMGVEKFSAIEAFDWFYRGKQANVLTLLLTL